MASHFLVKSEPAAYSFSRLVSEGRTVWDGVRNFEARNHLRSMRRGARVLYYHTGTERAVVGVAEVTRDPFADPTAKDGDWSAVELAPVAPLPRPVSLATLKATPSLAGLALLTRPRLSVVPVTADEYAEIVRLGGLRGRARGA